MAGVGFRSRYLPVKITESATGKLVRDYEGVIYAADHGAKVINLSWGGAGNYSKYGQDVINYAVLEKDAVVVAAGGNKNEQLDYYPASYENVLSVGATDIHDNKASWATYSHHIDLMAPGHQVYTTRNNGGYLVTTGSSFAAPLVSGAAALVRAQFPAFSAIQVMEQLRVTADDIYSTGNNMDYYGMLGRGRLNVYRALTEILSPSVRMSNLSWNGKFGSLIFPGDDVEINLEFTNYLRQADNLTITISSASGNFVLDENTLYIASLGENQVLSDAPTLRLKVDKDAKTGERLVFRIDYVGNFYNDFQYFEIPLTPDYFDISDGNMTATISGDGDIGFDDAAFKNGNGIRYKEYFAAHHAGLIISGSHNRVVNNVMHDFDNFTRDQDFRAEQHARLYNNSIADYDARSVFRPYDSIATGLPVRIEQKVLAWENPGQSGFVIFQYRLINIGDSTLHDLNAGIFADWDLGDHIKNAVETDATNKAGYVFDKSSGNLYAGLALLSNHDFSHFAMDIDSLHGNTTDLDGFFTDSLKHTFLSSDIIKHQAGAQGDGNDVAHIVGARNFDLPSGESTKVAIAMLAAESLDDFNAAVAAAREQYNLYIQNPQEGQTFFACHGDSALIDPDAKWFEIYSDAGLTHRLDSSTHFMTPPVVEEMNYYLVSLDSGYRSEVEKIIVKPGNPVAAFTAPDTMLIEHGQTAEISFENQSQLSDSWSWKFGNGYASSFEHPRTMYDMPGSYIVRLQVSNELGCADSVAHTILVAERAERPVITDQIICKNTSASIAASNTNAIRVFSDLSLNTLLYSGAAFTTGKISADTTFYITNYSGSFESTAVPVKISVQAPAMGFNYAPDTTNLADKYVLTIRDISETAPYIQWFVDGVLVSESETFSYVYDAQAFEITQVKADGDGCLDSLGLLIIPEQSPKPQNLVAEVCKNVPFAITPPDGNIFYFYTDPADSNPIHKGQTLELDKISENTIYYFANVDRLLEGMASEIQVQVNPLKAIIKVVSDSIELSQARGVQIENHADHAAESFWIFPSGTIDSRPVLIEDFDETGTYEYQLVARASEACSDTAHQIITVYTVTGLEDFLAENIRIFPNPASAEINIEMVQARPGPIKFKIMSVSGQVISQFQIDEHQTATRLNIEHFPAGIYFIESLTLPVSFRLVKQ